VRSAGFFHGALAQLADARFWADLTLSFIITVVLIGVAFAVVSQVPVIVAPFLLPLIMFGLLIGPIAVFVISVLRGRAGFATAPVLIFLALAGYRGLT
jgi:hypothetical protein